MRVRKACSFVEGYARTVYPRGAAADSNLSVVFGVAAGAGVVLGAGVVAGAPATRFSAADNSSALKPNGPGLLL